MAEGRGTFTYRVPASLFISQDVLEPGGDAELRAFGWGAEGLKFELIGHQSRSNAKNIVFNIEGCPDSAPVCIFQLGQKASLEVSFKTISTFTSTHLTMSGRYGPARVPIPLIPAEACDTWGLQCPSEAGVQQTLKIEVPIPRKGWLRGRFEFQMKLYDGKRALLLCKSFPVEI
ncbi:hypothetical protein E4U56_001711 [Claviceps arundinis]|uniref:Phosphatidylglycerol/phosphatidylinositol transfer protein n=1 Tax=Claviceps arundinis TaxID=1623583 RepID=A0A9P7SRJ0_9HYPO|nr:hypothetical protein E4U56_001711 [Claviceps arundinis]